MTTLASQQIDWQVAADDAATLPIGARAPSFDGLLGVDGKGYGLASFRDSRLVVLVFSSNRCPTAKAYTDRLNAIQAAYGPRGVQVVAINSNDPALYSAEGYSRMVAHAKSAGFKFPYLHDEGQLVARAYGPSVTFHAFVLDRERRLRYEGRVDDARVAANVTTRDLANALDDLLAGREVRVERTQPFGCSLDITATAVAGRSRAVLPALALTIGGAWALSLAAEFGGAAAALHHHSLIEGGPPLPIAVTLFSMAWLVMVAAMMLPSSLSAIQTFGAVAAVRGRSSASVAGFVGAYLVVWLLFGLLCFAGDTFVHRMVDMTPWLAQHSFVIEAALLGAAGAYQFMPFKRRFLEACRHATASSDSDTFGTRSGLIHAVDCVASSGPLMLVMFAAGVANMWWMVGLTGLMVYETTGRHGQTVARMAGALLLYLALFALANQGLPTWTA